MKSEAGKGSARRDDFMKFNNAPYWLGKVEKICPVCGGGFFADPRGKDFCSTKCADKFLAFKK